MALKSSSRRIRPGLQHLFARALRPAMVVQGSEVVGYSAHYPGETDLVWASTREAAVEGCDLRRLASRRGRDGSRG